MCCCRILAARSCRLSLFRNSHIASIQGRVVCRFYGSINSKPSYPPSSALGSCLLISKLWQMSYGGANLRVQMLRGGASERVQMTNLWNKKAIIAHKYMYFYTTCKSSDRFLTAKTATLSRIVYVLLSVISRSQVETIVHIYLHMLESVLFLKPERLSCF